MRRCLLISSLLFALAPLALASAAPVPPQAAVKQERIGDFLTEKKMLSPVDLRVSPDLKHFAYRLYNDSNWYMVIDGKKGPEFAITSVAYMGGSFSPDSKHFAYYRTADDHNSWTTMLDGKEIDHASKLTFSPDGKRLAYRCEKNHSAWMNVDGKDGPPYAQAEDPTFSQDSRHFAYLATVARQDFLVLDGIPGPRFDVPLHSLEFSPDSAHIAVSTGKTAIIDGKPDPTTFDYVDNVTFSPDSSHIAYVVKQLDKWAVVRDGKASTMFDAIGRIQFSPDSKHLACVVKLNNKWMMQLDEQQGPPFSRPDGNEMYIIPHFSTDSKHLAYTGMNASKYITFFDGNALPNESKFPAFSPDSRRTAYVQRSLVDKSWALVVDQQPGPVTLIAFQPVFSSDSKHIASFARDENGLFALLDGQSGPRFSRILSDSDDRNPTPHFNEDGSITYVAVSQNVAYTVTQFPPAKN